MPTKPKVAWRYFAQVGSELIEVPAEEVEAHGKGVRFSTSAPIFNYRARAIVGDPDKGAITYEGVGSSWDEATKSAAAQIGASA